MYKYHHKMMPTTLDRLFMKNQQIHQYNTRGAARLRPPKIKTCLAENFITTTGVRIWNLLSTTIDPTQKIGTFKQKVITSLISSYNN